ncbi:unnamed protein product [Sphagnum jensenii]|uniref:Uncharacterized protein n=1 Tax=Sphagnum jensenii TaxID=128206 RepID=A0ABP0VGX2_9BRYO
MALRDEILPYVDGNDLVAPNPVSPGTLKGSDNGPMFTSEYFIMLLKLGQLIPSDTNDFQNRIGQCVNAAGMLCRVPASQDDGQEEVDDYYGVLNGCKQMENTSIPRTLLWSLIKHFGVMNNENPGQFQWRALMIRQPQLVACMVAAAFPSWKNPLHILARALCHPLFFYAAICTLIAGMTAPTSDTDTRRLSWHVWQCTKGVSLLCWLAGKVWLNRLYKQYGPTGMKAVAAIYYQPHPVNPFSKYWVTE